MTDTQSLARELAPTGTLRVGLNRSNFLLVQHDANGDRGVAADLGREIGRRLGVPVSLHGYKDAGAVADAVGEWDVAFIGVEPARASRIAFTPAYVEIEATYMVPPGSAIRSVEEVDRPGIRIAAADRAAYELYLARTLKHAGIVRAPGLDASFDLFVKEKLEALAGLRPKLMSDLARLPGARILEGRFTAVQQAIGTPIERAAGIAFLREFVAEAKRGLVAEAIARHGIQGLTVAP